MTVDDQPEARGPIANAHVVFELEADEDGWPPVRSERVWAHALGEDHYRIDNPPWFVPDLAVGDIVRASTPHPESDPVFQEMVERSDHVTVRIIVFKDGPLGGQLQPVFDAFTPFGVHCEGAHQYRIVALDVPADASLRGIHTRLLKGTRDGSWAYDEGRITVRWHGLYEH